MLAIIGMLLAGSQVIPGLWGAAVSPFRVVPSALRQVGLEEAADRAKAEVIHALAGTEESAAPTGRTKPFALKVLYLFELNRYARDEMAAITKRFYPAVRVVTVTSLAALPNDLQLGSAVVIGDWRGAARGRRPRTMMPPLPWRVRSWANHGLVAVFADWAKPRVVPSAVLAVPRPPRIREFSAPFRQLLSQLNAAAQRHREAERARASTVIEPSDAQADDILSEWAEHAVPSNVVVVLNRTFCYDLGNRRRLLTFGRRLASQPRLRAQLLDGRLFLLTSDFQLQALFPKQAVLRQDAPRRLVDKTILYVTNNRSEAHEFPGAVLTGHASGPFSQRFAERVFMPLWQALRGSASWPVSKRRVAQAKRLAEIVSLETFYDSPPHPDEMTAAFALLEMGHEHQRREALNFLETAVFHPKVPPDPPQAQRLVRALMPLLALDRRARSGSTTYQVALNAQWLVQRMAQDARYHPFLQRRPRELQTVLRVNARHPDRAFRRWARETLQALATKPTTSRREMTSAGMEEVPAIRDLAGGLQAGLRQVAEEIRAGHLRIVVYVDSPLFLKMSDAEWAEATLAIERHMADIWRLKELNGSEPSIRLFRDRAVADRAAAAIGSAAQRLDVVLYLPEWDLLAAEPWRVVIGGKTTPNNLPVAILQGVAHYPKSCYLLLSDLPPPWSLKETLQHLDSLDLFG